MALAPEPFTVVIDTDGTVTIHQRGGSRIVTDSRDPDNQAIRNAVARLTGARS